VPNHVHVVVELLQGHRLGAILHSWKSFTANKTNTLIGRTGAFWHDDFFDRYMRDEDHLERTIGYVEQNPVKASLVGSAEKWPWSSARFR
jgi:REP element-mobilizing transposase RayT